MSQKNKQLFLITFRTVLTSSNETLECCSVFTSLGMSCYDLTCSQIHWVHMTAQPVLACNVMTLHVHGYSDFTWVTNQYCIPKLWPYTFIATLISHDQPILHPEVMALHVHSYTDMTNQLQHGMLKQYAFIATLTSHNCPTNPGIPCLWPYTAIATMTSHDSPTNSHMPCYDPTSS